MAIELSQDQQREIGHRNRLLQEDFQKARYLEAEQALLSNPDNAALGALINEATLKSHTGALHLLLSERERRRLGMPKNWVSTEGRKPQRTRTANGYIETPPPVTEREMRPAPQPSNPNPLPEVKVYGSKSEMERELALKALLNDTREQ